VGTGGSISVWPAAARCCRLGQGPGPQPSSGRLFSGLAWPATMRGRSRSRWTAKSWGRRPAWHQNRLAAISGGWMSAAMRIAWASCASRDQASVWARRISVPTSRRHRRKYVCIAPWPGAGEGGSVRRVVGAARNSLRSFAFGGASLPPHCRRAESADRAGMSGPRGVGRRARSLGVRPAHAAGICPPPRPGQPTTCKKSVRVMSVDSCSGTRVQVARARIVDGLPQLPRNESGHLGGSWRDLGHNISPLLLWRLHAGRIRSLGAAGDLPAYSLA
jgi:hypothetical protein